MDGQHINVVAVDCIAGGIVAVEIHANISPGCAAIGAFEDLAVCAKRGVIERIIGTNRELAFTTITDGDAGRDQDGGAI